MKKISYFLLIAVLLNGTSLTNTSRADTAPGDDTPPSCPTLTSPVAQYGDTFQFQRCKDRPCIIKVLGGDCL